MKNGTKNGGLNGSSNGSSNGSLNGHVRRPPKVLVADDELLLAQSIEADLRDLGIGVIGPAPDGAKAVSLARDHKPDLALMDLRMPQMDGLAASRVLYEELGIPVVILSAYSDTADVEESQDIGVFGYLLKPVNADTLRVTLEVAWSKYQAEQRLTEEVDGLNRKLEERKLVERAKGIIMEQRGITEPAAMKLLQKQARDHRKPMVELARSVIESHALLS